MTNGLRRVALQSDETASIFEQVDPGILNSFATALLEQNTLEDIVWCVAQKVGAVLGFEDCVIYVKRGDALVQAATFGTKSPHQREIKEPIIIPVGQGIVGTVAQTGVPELIDDTQKDPRYIPDQFEGRSELAVPILFRDDVLGVLDSECSRPSGYGPGDMALMQAVAALMAPRLAWAIQDGDRRRREEAPTRGSAWFDPLFNPHPLARVSADGVVTYANDAAAECFGAAGWKVGRVLPEFWTGRISDALISRINRRIEVAVGVRTFAVDIIPFPEAGAVNIYGLDITDRKQVESKLQESEERYGSLFRHSLDGIILHDLKGRIVDANSRAADLLGYQIEELLALGIEDLSPQGALEATRGEFDKLTTRGFVKFVTTFRHKTGRTFAAEVSASLFEVRGVSLIQASLRDITERQRAETALRASEEKYRSILASMEDGYYEVDLAGRITFHNNALARIFRYPLGELLGRNYRENMTEQDAAQLYRQFNAVYRSRQPAQNIAWEIIAKDGSRRTVEGSVSLTVDSQGEPVGFRGVLRDVTERELQKARLAQAREQEIVIGAEIQEMFLYGKPPADFPGAVMDAVSIPSQRMDGDFMDFFTHERRYLDVLVGDMMGKGIPAALLGAAVKSQFVRALEGLRSRQPGDLPSPAEIVGRVHVDLTQKLMDLETFATACYTRFDLLRQRGRFVNCGHPRAIHYKGGVDECVVLKGSNLPLGFLRDHVYEEHSFTFETGDLFLFYSDGLTEARSKSGEMFGEKRLLSLVRSWGQLQPAALIERLREEIHQHVGSPIMTDDLTLIAVRVCDPVERFYPLTRELRISRTTAELANLRDFVKQCCHGAWWIRDRETFAAELQLAAQEAVTNIIKHGGGSAFGSEPIDVRIEILLDRASVTLTYKGPDFQADTVGVPDLRSYPEDGFGLFIMANTVNTVSYGAPPDGHVTIRLGKLIRT